LAPSDEGPAVRLADGEWAIEVTPTLLFRFSALTYNAHRIHYDRDYARDVEGYPGLLTHGPLQALAMAEAARAAEYCRDHDDRHLHFDYRLVSPLFDFQGMTVSAVRENDAMMTAVRDIHGRKTASGTLRSACRSG
jgi:3-methylfumaryl-CoA hydratase